MNIKECYEKLELPPTATEVETRQAYKNLVKSWHPDKFQTDSPMKAYAEERIKIINAAYDLVRKHQSSTRIDSVVKKAHQPPEAFKSTASTKDTFQKFTDFTDPLGRCLKDLTATLKGIFFSFAPLSSNFPETNKDDTASKRVKKPFKRVFRDLKSSPPRNVNASKLNGGGFRSIHHLRRSYGPRSGKGLGGISGIATEVRNQSIRPVSRITPIKRVE